MIRRRKFPASKPKIAFRSISDAIETQTHWFERVAMAESEVEERASSAGPQPSAFACWPGGHQEGSVQTEAPAGALGSNGAGSAEGSIPAVRIWGRHPS